MLLGEKLIQKGLISTAQLDQANAEQLKAPGTRLGDILVQLGYVSREQIEAALA